MARELSSEEAKILKREGDFTERLTNNGLAKIERASQSSIVSSEFSSQSSKS